MYCALIAVVYAMNFVQLQNAKERAYNCTHTNEYENKKNSNNQLIDLLFSSSTMLQNMLTDAKLKIVSTEFTISYNLLKRL